MGGVLGLRDGFKSGKGKFVGRHIDDQNILKRPAISLSSPIWVA
jgi:hypothetical protein